MIGERIPFCIGNDFRQKAVVDISSPKCGNEEMTEIDFPSRVILGWFILEACRDAQCGIRSFEHCKLLLLVN
jgi:hypothetical protein